MGEATVNVAARLDSTAAARPDHVALVFGGGEQSWTYAELDQRASQVAAALGELGLEPGGRVALFLTNSPDHVACWFGALKAGVVPVDMNFVLGDEEWRYILDDCAPSAAIVAAPFSDRVDAIAASLGFPVIEAGPTPGGRRWLWSIAEGTPRTPAAAVDPDKLAVIAYTSGTTGLPKGVMHSHGRLNLALDLMAEILSTTSDDVIPTFLPLFPLHANLTQAGLAVAKQATLLLLEKFDPVELAELCRRLPVSAGTMVPAIVSGLLAMPEEARPRFASGSRFNVGGAPLPPATRDAFESAFSTTLLQGFGSTEVMGAIAMERIDDRAPWGSCGSLWPGMSVGTSVRVVDDDGVDVAPGEVGEFLVHRDRALLGYWNAPELTAEAFLDGDWYRMGDIGRIDADGFVYLLDRKKDMIIRGGFNIYCAELERVLVEDEAVAEAYVVGAEDAGLGEVPKAYIVLRQGQDPSDDLAARLQSAVLARLGKLKALDQVAFVAPTELPRNAMGKVLKRDLRTAPIGSTR
jgi:long-chain acyl-CoA synthetase